MKAGFIITVGPAKGFCESMNDALRVGRGFCSTHGAKSFSVTNTVTGECSRFPKDVPVVEARRGGYRWKQNKQRV
jgi:hypothetical protein